MRTHAELIHICIREDVGAIIDELLHNSGVEGRVVFGESLRCRGRGNDAGFGDDVSFYTDESALEGSCDHVSAKVGALAVVILLLTLVVSWLGPLRFEERCRQARDVTAIAW